MKKIITAVAAIAMATTMFAADVAATVKMAGNLFDLAADGTVKMLNVTNDAVANHKAVLALSANGDKAGASMKFLNNYTDKGGNAVAFQLGDHAVWFAPAESFKITLGNSDANVNQEKIGWCNSDLAVAGYGFKADVNVDAFTASVMLYPGKAKNDNGNGVFDSYYFDKDTIAETDVKIGYSADWGSVGALYKLADAKAKKMMFGAGYSGAVDSTSYFFNAMAYMNDGKMTNIHAEAYVSTAIESVGISVFVPMSYQTGDSGTGWYNQGWHKGCNYYAEKGAFQLGTLAKVTMPVSSMNASVELSSNDWLAKEFAMNLKPGLAGSCGSMGWEVYLNMNIAKEFTMNVPFVATVNF